MSLKHSPATIIKELLTSSDFGYFTDPIEHGFWPLYIGHMPDGDLTKDDCGAVYDTSGVRDGRLMEGEVIFHYGLQLKIRSAHFADGWEKANAVASRLAQVKRELIEVEDTEYRIDNLSQTTQIIPLGLEEGTKRRFLSTINFITTIQEV